MKLRLEATTAFLLLFIAAGASPARAQVVRGDWENLVGASAEAFDGPVLAVVFDPSGQPVVGGQFESAGGQVVKSLARWNGTQWVGFGGGFERYVDELGAVEALAFSDGILYAGGFFELVDGQPILGVAAWDGTSWSALGEGLGAFSQSVEVYAIVADGSGGVYIGGRFALAGGGAASGIAHWNGQEWTPLGEGVTGEPGLDDEEVFALALDDAGHLYAGGSFTLAGGIPASRVAVWSGSSWTPLGDGVDGPVYSLALDGSSVFAGGRFGSAGARSARNVAHWDGQQWRAMGEGLCPETYSLARARSTLFASASLDCDGGSGTRRFGTVWNGESWVAMGSGSSRPIYVMHGLEDRVVVGSDASFQVEGISASGVAFWRLAEASGRGSILEPDEPGSIRSAYPNPFGRSLTIEFSTRILSPVRLSIVNVLGQTVFSETLFNRAAPFHWLSPPEMGPGLYVVSAISEMNEGSDNLVVFHAK